MFSGSGAKCFDIGNIEDQLGDGLTTFAPSAQGMKHDVAPGADGIFQLDDAIAFFFVNSEAKMKCVEFGDGVEVANVGCCHGNWLVSAAGGMSRSMLKS